MSRPLPSTVSYDAETVQRLTRNVDQAFETLARLSGSATPSTEFFQTLTEKTISLINAIAAAIWLKTPHGLLQKQHQSNLDRVGIDNVPEGWQLHEELLRHALTFKRPFIIDPNTKLTVPSGKVAGNVSANPLVIAPVFDDQGGVFGLLEFWLEVNSDPNLRNVYINIINRSAGYASTFLRNTTALRNTVQEQVYAQVEEFSRKIHSSLNPTEVAFLVVNEGRRLIGCDRLSAGVRHGRRAKVEAVSGADVVERSSVQVKAMVALFDAVLDWNERLVYQGTRDPSLPPKVLSSLDDYLTQSNSKLLVLQPLRDERESIQSKDKEAKIGPARSALLLECFETPPAVEPMIERLGIVAGHSASALYNAAEMKRIPFYFVWKPILSLQGAAGGKNRFYTMLALVTLAALFLFMFFFPYPLKLDAKGQLEPEEWNYIYSPGQGKVVEVRVHAGQVVFPNTPIAMMYELDLSRRIADQRKEIENSEALIRVLGAQAADSNLTPEKRKEKASDLAQENDKNKSLKAQFELLLQGYNADSSTPGQFTVFAPEFQRARHSRGPAIWKVVSADFEHQLLGKTVKPSDPLLRVGNTEGAWHIEQKIPQKHISQLLRAYKTDNPDEYLEVDVLLTSKPTETFKGRLYRRDISGEAVQNKDDHNESELIVYAYVRVNDPDMPAEDHIPAKDLVTGIEVHTKIRCGDHSLGYTLFNGAWEFFYEHVVFAL